MLTSIEFVVIVKPAQLPHKVKGEQFLQSSLCLWVSFEFDCTVVSLQLSTAQHGTVDSNRI